MDGTSARTTLGVAPTANEADIKAAYRAQAKALHPDRGGDARQFAYLTSAYECALADARRRRVVTIAARPRLGRPAWTRTAVTAAAHAASVATGRRPAGTPSRVAAPATFADHLRRAGAA